MFTYYNCFAVFLSQAQVTLSSVLLTFIYIFCFILAVLGFELRALYMLGRHSTTWATPLDLIYNLAWTEDLYTVSNGGL
jgi:hypothetical protein